MNTDVQILDAEKRLTLQQEVIDVMRDTFCKGFSDAEFAYCVQLVKQTGLSPVKKEIWFLKIQDKIQTMTGINGYFAIANAHPQYDGMESDFTTDEKGQVVSAWCKVYRKDRAHPQTAKVLFREYFDANKPLWRAKPATMLLKVAESVALRKAFPQELNGTYTEEEMPSEFSAKAYPQKLREVGDVARTETGSAEVVAVIPQETASDSVDWAQYKFVYEIKARKDQFRAIADTLKANKGKWRPKKNKDGQEIPGGDNLWYCNVFIDDLARFARDNPLYQNAEQQDLFGGDTPAWES